MSNGIYIFYLIALIPAIIGAILFMCRAEINWKEWLGGTAIAFLLSGIMHVSAIYSMTADVETLSGEITHVSHSPAWEGRYTEHHSETTTDSKGNSHTRHWTDTHYESHPEHWDAYLGFGITSEEKSIDHGLYNQIVAKFGSQTSKTGSQGCFHMCTCIGGDDSIYTTMNKTGYIYPVTTTHSFENRIKAAPTLFSFAKVPSNVVVYAWPSNPNWMQSDRLLGVTGINIREWDLLNSRLGFKKGVNLILIGFASADSTLGDWQRAKYIGGRKNDIVMCYGFDGTNTLWSKVFGWSDSEICKRNLETILLEHPINDSIIPIIENEIRTGYVIKDWSKFDYISIEPPRWAYVTLIILMLVSQGAFWVWSLVNEFDKNGTNYRQRFGKYVDWNGFRVKNRW